MDVVEHLPEVHGVGADDNVVYLAEQRLKPSDLHLLSITSVDQVKDIAERYAQLKFPRDRYDVFLTQLTQSRDAWFIDAGGTGLVYLTNVVPRHTSTLNFVFWDSRITADRREAIRSVVVTAFTLFELPRMNALCPYTGPSLEKNPLAMTLKKLGFALEGVARKGYTMADGSHRDMVLFGCIDDEVKTWPVIPLTISSV